MSQIVQKRLLSVGRSNDGNRPFVVRLEFFEGKPPIQQPVSEKEFLEMVNSLLDRLKPTIGVKVE